MTQSELYEIFHNVVQRNEVQTVDVIQTCLQILATIAADSNRASATERQELMKRLVTNYQAEFERLSA
jgi:hypothetical protein